MYQIHKQMDGSKHKRISHHIQTESHFHCLELDSESLQGAVLYPFHSSDRSRNGIQQLN
uniref:AlNc14C53G4122 protein n=1 Tax=Albugo laibachii Nc14 TaxID=890382 RepID=F0WBT1_9STRA|nr:AlNc14C53G4122 [Albugo laibachii Nc14]|eukprot:CCA18608.1 AlNc14C53G4122 [Albugo laibachii Nc14]